MSKQTRKPTTSPRTMAATYAIARPQATDLHSISIVRTEDEAGRAVFQLRASFKLHGVDGKPLVVFKSLDKLQVDHLVEPEKVMPFIEEVIMPLAEKTLTNAV